MSLNPLGASLKTKFWRSQYRPTHQDVEGFKGEILLKPFSF